MYFYNPQFYHVFTDWILETWGTSKTFEGCPVSDCIVTKGKVPIEKIDGIIFKPRDMGYCPPYKPPGQVWIFAEFETPNYFFQSKCFYDLKNKVNWTMTYRRDADFPIAHGYFRRGSKRKYSQKDLDDIFAKKTKTAVVFISHCPTVGKRLQFSKVLQSYGIQVDVFGLCGTKTLQNCDNKDRYKASFNVTGDLKPDCFGTVLSEYNFFSVVRIFSLYRLHNRKISASDYATPYYTSDTRRKQRLHVSSTQCLPAHKRLQIC